LVGSTLKLVANRERPNSANRFSFPSGHTYGAFASATALSYAYGWKAAVIMFPVATFVGLSRMADDEHWLSDVVGGTFLGFYCGRSAYYGDSRASAARSMWLPLFERDRAGAQWIAQF
jgi:membrane-associated phospholipid phosphatase